VTEKPEEGLSYKNTVEKVRQLGGVAVAPHPFQKTRHGVSKSKIKDIDAIEAFNAWLFTGFQNRRAKKFADKNDYPKVAGSDAHSLGMVGRAYTQIQIEKPRSEIRSEDVVEALRNGDVTMEGRRAPIYRATYHYIKASIRKAMYYTSKGLEKINKQLKRYTLPLRKVKKLSLRDELKRLLKE